MISFIKFQFIKICLTKKHFLIKEEEIMNYHWEGVAENSALDLIKLQAAFPAVEQNLVCSIKAREACGAQPCNGNHSCVVAIVFISY